MDDTANWKEGKSYHKHTVKTFHRKKGPKDGTGWYARVSEHDKDDATFEEFWSKLGEDKANNEMQCVFKSLSQPTHPSFVLYTALEIDRGLA